MNIGNPREKSKFNETWQLETLHLNGLVLRNGEKELGEHTDKSMSE